MTVSNTENQAQDIKQDTSEINLSKQRKMYEAQLQQKEQERMQALQELEAMKRDRQKVQHDDDDDDAEPYVDKKRFKKGLNQFGEQIKTQTKAEIEQAVHSALEQERRENYLKDNKDFGQTMNENNLQELMEKFPGIAQGILRMPEGFERQKLVYENIKALGIGKPKAKDTSIQQKVDANRRSPYYQPTDTGTAPYSQAGDFSTDGKKAAFNKMQELKKRLRLS